MVKADGLAAGKGVVVAENKDQALAAIDDIMMNKRYGGTCGEHVIIEELLIGYEVSVSKQ